MAKVLPWNLRVELNCIHGTLTCDGSLEPRSLLEIPHRPPAAAHDMRHATCRILPSQSNALAVLSKRSFVTILRHNS